MTNDLKDLARNKFVSIQGCEFDGFLSELKFELIGYLQVRVLYFQFFEFKFEFGSKHQVYRVVVVDYLTPSEGWGHGRRP